MPSRRVSASREPPQEHSRKLQIALLPGLADQGKPDGGEKDEGRTETLIELGPSMSYAGLQTTPARNCHKCARS